MLYRPNGRYMNKQRSFLIILMIVLCSSCAPKTANPVTPTILTSPSDTAIVMVQPTTTLVSSETPEPTATATPDITVLRTQKVSDPWIVTTLGTKIPPPWYRQRVMFSPDNRFLASSYNNKISLWAVPSFQKLSEADFLTEQYSVDRIAFSSDGEFLAASAEYYDDEQTHLFVWNTASMDLQFSTPLEQATLNHDPDTSPYQFPVTAVGFIPNSHRLVTGNGNSLQIIDMEDTGNSITMDLGHDMYASDIAFPADGRFIYVFMEWWKDNGITAFPPRLQTKYVAQIWDTNNHFLWRTLNFPQLGWSDETKSLEGPYLATSNSIKGTFEIMSLENEEVTKLPYRQGWSYMTADRRFVLFSRYFGISPESDRGMELWTTDSWRMLYKFQPDFYDFPDKEYPLGSDPGELVISDDNRYMAIAYAGQIFVYDMRILTAP